MSETTPAAIPTGVATGTGSLPGTDIDEAVRIVFGELPDWPYLPELPERGLGADMIGRGANLLADLPVQWWASGWQLADRPGRDARRARDLRERDLDALHEAAANTDAPVRLTAVGPFTLAANLWRRAGGAMIADHGAVADLAASLAEGLRGHVAAAAARLPKARWSLQLDEPMLPAALAGRIPTESGLQTYRRVHAETARDRLRAVIDGVGVPVVVHCCADDVPLALLREAGAAAAAVDLTLVDSDDVRAMDTLGEYLDAGGLLVAGVVPSTGTVEPGIGAAAAKRLTELWGRLGFEPERLPRQVAVSTTCGLARATPDYARAAMEASREAATILHG